MLMTLCPHDKFEPVVGYLSQEEIMVLSTILGIFPPQTEELNFQKLKNRYTDDLEN